MIKKPNELRFDDKKLSMIIAGVPGIGKTTLALSSPKPLLIDLDNGISRVEARYRKDTLIASDYAELIKDLKEEDLSGYETIVIDTGGKLLEFLKPVVIKEDAKNGKKDGNLSLQGYGAIKKKFREFINFVKGLNKNLIVVFHASEVNLDNDLTGLRIRIEGSSRDDVWDDMDIGGFVEMNGKDRTIGFNNCERYYAKGTHGIHGIYQLPTLDNNTKNTFIADLFKKIKEDLNNETIEVTKYEETMKCKPEIEKVENTEKLNEIYTTIKTVEHHLTSKEELWFVLTQKAKELGVKYDKDTDRFE